MSRRSSRYRTAPPRNLSTGCWGCPGARPSCAKNPLRARRRLWSSLIKSAGTCTVIRRGPTEGPASRRWHAPRENADTTTWRSAITPLLWAPCGDLPRTTSGDRVRRLLLSMKSWRRSACCGESSATSSRTAGSTFPTSGWRSSTGYRRVCTVDSECPGGQLTERVEEALRNPHVRCLSHPTGRLISRRPENALDLERVFEVAVQHHVALEINGLPARLDLRGEHVRDAIQAGAQLVCSTDAHSTRGLANMTLSIATARRGWATTSQVVNTRPLHTVLHRERRAG